MKQTCPKCKYEFNNSVLFIDMDDKPIVVDAEYTTELPVEVDCSAINESNRAIKPGAVAWFLFAAGQAAVFKICTDNGGSAFARFDANIETGFAILPVRRKEMVK